ncbi:hypothetical protein [Sphingobium fluviale]|uniref:Biopolymer transporter ExbB n=1 Tax=Sphingobium fluviale TaxID=2506423 RepID=A0A4Q1KI41_9SPHN|nr:hypothetical protein [Sphingobium fluviale]RXR29458.1 hypothetical protein EQG66_05760 [Sphingobium fluviale]
MEQKIRSELMKMTGIMVILAGLGIYAHEFVIDGIMAKAALNLSIFALFGLAASIAFRHVIALKNEVVALKALQVDYGERARRPLDPYKHPAILFEEPELLGHGYNLIAEEMSKKENFQISNATVQMILHDVDMRINDRKSTLMYFSGLMVFLGLLGAFMGLMKTVHSVSDLIGSMDMSGKGGTDAFGKMIEGMKAPLNGMSVGFSSSLFGLMTSMVLGALERFMTSAMKTLRNEFEHWLANVSALEAPQSDSAQRETVELGNVIRALELGGKHLRDLRETVLDSALTQQQTQSAVAEMTGAVASLGRSTEKLSDPTPLLQPISDCVAELAKNQTMMVAQFNGLISEAQRDRDTISHALAEMRDMIERNNALSGARLHAQMDRMTTLQAELLAKDGSSLSVSHYRREGEGGGILSRMAGLLVKGEAVVEAARERRRLRAEVRRMLAGQRRLVRKVERTFGGSLGRIEQAREKDAELIARLAMQAEANNARLAVLMERLQLADEAGDGAAPALAAGMHGARLEMEVLKRRLDALQESDDAARAGTQQQDAPRATGTDGNPVG